MSAQNASIVGGISSKMKNSFLEKNSQKVNVNFILIFLVIALFVYSLFMTLSYYKGKIVQENYKTGYIDGMIARNQQIVQDLQNNGFTVLNIISSNETQNITEKIALYPQLLTGLSNTDKPE